MTEKVALKGSLLNDEMPVKRATCSYCGMRRMTITTVNRQHLLRLHQGLLGCAHYCQRYQCPELPSVR